MAVQAFGEDNVQQVAPNISGCHSWQGEEGMAGSSLFQGFLGICHQRKLCKVKLFVGPCTCCSSGIAHPAGCFGCPVRELEAVVIELMVSLDHPQSGFVGATALTCKVVKWRTLFQGFFLRGHGLGAALLQGLWMTIAAMSKSHPRYLLQCMTWGRWLAACDFSGSAFQPANFQMTTPWGSVSTGIQLHHHPARVARCWSSILGFPFSRGGKPTYRLLWTLPFPRSLTIPCLFEGLPSLFQSHTTLWRTLGSL